MSQNPQKENNEEGNPSDVNLFNNSKEKKKSSLKSFVGSDYYKDFSDFKNSSDSEVSKKRANSLKDKEYKFDDFNVIREKIKDEKRKTISSIKDKGSEPFITLSFSKNFEKQLIDAFSKQSKTFRQNMENQSTIFLEEMKEQNSLFQNSLEMQAKTFLESLKAGFLLQSENFEQKLIVALNLQSMKQKEEIKNDSDRPNENGNSNIQKGPTDPQ